MFVWSRQMVIQKTTPPRRGRKAGFTIKDLEVTGRVLCSSVTSKPLLKINARSTLQVAISN